MGDEAWNIASGWRWMLGMEVVPALVFMLLLFAVPESPRWLAQRGRDGEAPAILEKVGGREHAVRELAAIRAGMQQEEGRFSELFTRAYFRPLLIARAADGVFPVLRHQRDHLLFDQDLRVGRRRAGRGLHVLGLDRAGQPACSPSSRSRWWTGPAAGRCCSSGRSARRWRSGWWGGCSTPDGAGSPLLVCVVAFIAAFAMSTGPMSWVICSEIFPNKVRGRAMSVATFTVWTSCYVVAQTFPMLNDSPAVGPALTFWFYAAVSLMALVFVAAMVPETKGRTLEAIEHSWRAAEHATAGTRIGIEKRAFFLPSGQCPF